MRLTREQELHQLRQLTHTELATEMENYAESSSFVRAGRLRLEAARRLRMLGELTGGTR